MLILIVLICILVWYAVKRYKRSKETDGLLDEGEMSLRKEIREIVLKYKLLILIGSTVVVVGSIGWMYYMFYVPYTESHVISDAKDTWQFGSQLVWVRFFARSANQSRNSAAQHVCGEFSKDQCLHNMDVLKNYSMLNSSLEVLHRLSDNRSEAREQMYNINTKVPVVVTQSSADNFDSVQKFVKESEVKLLSRFPDYAVLIYDMGMTFQQKYILLNCSQCQVIEDFPKNFMSHSWTPVFIYMTLQKYTSVIWVNTSTVQIDKLPSFLQNEGQFPGFHVNKTTRTTNVRPRRSVKTISSWNKEAELSTSQSESTLEGLLETKSCQRIERKVTETNLIYANTSPFTMQNIILPWTICSVNGECTTKDQCKPSTHTDSADYCNNDVMSVDLILNSLFGNAASLFYS